MKFSSLPTRTAGFTLMEVVVAIAIIAITLPLAISFITISDEESRTAEQGTHAVLIARSMFQQIDSFGSIQGHSPENTQWLIFELNNEGSILRKAEGMNYDNAWQGIHSDTTAIAAIKAFPQNIFKDSSEKNSALQIQQIEIRIETPARAKAIHRKRQVFIKKGLTQG